MSICEHELRILRRIDESREAMRSADRPGTRLDCAWSTWPRRTSVQLRNPYFTQVSDLLDALNV